MIHSLGMMKEQCNTKCFERACHKPFFTRETTWEHLWGRASGIIPKSSYRTDLTTNQTKLPETFCQNYKKKCYLLSNAFTPCCWAEGITNKAFLKLDIQRTTIGLFLSITLIKLLRPKHYHFLPVASSQMVELWKQTSKTIYIASKKRTSSLNVFWPKTVIHFMLSSWAFTRLTLAFDTVSL